MLVGAEIQARADAQAALELAEAARGSALLDALATIASRESGSAEDRGRAASEIVRVLVLNGFIAGPEAGAAVDALGTAGVLEAAFVEAVVAEAEDALGRDS